MSVSDRIPTLRTLTPGAKISTAWPKLEKLALASLFASMAPTVMAWGAEPGEVLAASCYLAVLLAKGILIKQQEGLHTFSLPAATTGTTPAVLRAWIARLTAREREPPRDMFITALPEIPRLWTSSMTNCMPLRTPELAPRPSAPKTLTATRLTFLETPNVAPPMVPAT